MRRRQSRQSGQGIIEMALVLPVLVMIMAAAGYFGFAMTTQQRLAMGARQAARAVSAASSMANEKGANLYVATISGGTYQAAAMGALDGLDPARITVTAPAWGRAARPVTGMGASSLTGVGSGFAALFTFTNPAAKASPPFVAGCLFYGCTLNYRLQELDWLATLMGQRATGLTVSATCVMPGELPMRGFAPQPIGLLDLNQGLIKQAAADPLGEVKYTNMPKLVKMPGIP
ncbi:MAG: pilus assembly protein [Candidatus Sericytochromatia bacterium]|nr:pilus assembly protein [Candidatus Sericytochromatia bacterium]